MNLRDVQNVNLEVFFFSFVLGRNLEDVFFLYRLVFLQRLKLAQKFTKKAKNPLS